MKNNSKILFLYHPITHKEITHIEKDYIAKRGYKTYYHYYGKRENETLLYKFIRIFKDAIEIRQLLLNEKINLLYINSAFNRNGFFRDYLTLLLIPKSFFIYIKFHGSDINLLETKNILIKKSLKRFLKKVNGLGVLSKEEKQNFIEFGLDASKIFVVKNLLLIEKFKSSLKKDNNKIIKLLFIARFIPSKGLLTVIKSLEILIIQNYKVQLIAIGDGEEISKAINFISSKKLNPFITFTKFIPEEETYRYYSTSDILVFPTFHQEGFPMTVFRSVAAGLPIITTKIRAAADYLKEPDNCLWVEPRNPEMLSEKIIYLIEHPELREQMSKNNKELVKQFTADKIAEEFIEIYKYLIRTTVEETQ